jgi:hypothetical protein
MGSNINCGGVRPPVVGLAFRLKEVSNYSVKPIGFWQNLQFWRRCDDMSYILSQRLMFGVGVLEGPTSFVVRGWGTKALSGCNVR